MKRYLKDFKSEYDRKLDELIKPNEDEIFDSAEDVVAWLQEVIDLEDAPN